MDVSAKVPGQLHGHMSHATRTTVNQYSLSSSSAGSLQAFKGCNANQWQRRGLPHRKALWFVGNQPGISQHVFCKRALQVGESSGATVHLVARGKVSNTFTHSFDGTGEVHTQYRRQVRRKR